MNLLAILPSLLSGNMTADDAAKALGLIKRTVTSNEIESVLTRLCEDAVRPVDLTEVIEVTGVIGGKKIRCVLVADRGLEKNLLKG